MLNTKTFDWYPVFGLGSKPSAQFPRSDMTIAKRREPAPEETYAILQGAVIAECTYGAHTGGEREVRLAMDAEALAAFSSWLESSPPGANYSVGRFT